MKTMYAILLSTTMSGCAFLAGNAPSMQYCDKVVYARDGNKIAIQASCTAPIGSPGLPVVMP